MGLIPPSLSFGSHSGMHSGGLRTNAQVAALKSLTKPSSPATASKPALGMAAMARISPPTQPLRWDAARGADGGSESGECANE